MEFATTISPHMRPQNSVTIVMLQVLLAAIPGIAAMTWFYGFGVLINIFIALIVAIVAEAAVLIIRAKSLVPLTDGSAAVTGVLLALALPPLVPWWIPVVGVLFAILIAKHLYGGLGYNPFNPAMIGYVVLLISFPQQMTLWVSPEVSLTLADDMAMVFGGFQPDIMDAISGATILDAVRTGLSQQQTVHQIVSMPVVAGAKAVSLWVSAGFLLGGVALIYRRVIHWHIPAGFLLGLFGIAAFFNFLDAQQYPSPFLHLMSGATMLGAFFIATDPVTAATSPRGRLIYGVLIGVLVFVIRSWGGYPDAVAFAVLLMNICAPTIDHYTKPRVFGHS